MGIALSFIFVTDFLVFEEIFPQLTFQKQNSNIAKTIRRYAISIKYINKKG